jgi:hypothetical protein
MSADAAVLWSVLHWRTMAVCFRILLHFIPSSSNILKEGESNLGIKLLLSAAF